GTDNTLSDIRSIEIFFIEFSNCFYHRFPKGRQMGPPLRGKLPIDEGIILLPILVGVSKSYFNVMAFEVNDGIPSAFLIQFSAYQIQQTVFGEKLLSIVIDGQSGIEERIIPYLVFQIIRNKMVVFENCRIRRKDDFRPVTFRAFFNRLVADQHAFLKFRHFGFTISVRLNLKVVGQSVKDRKSTRLNSSHVKISYAV